MTITAKGLTKGNFPEELNKVLESLAKKWGDVEADMKNLQVIQLSGAMTNEVFQINWPTIKGDDLHRKVLVRVYGKGVDLFFNREDEIKTFECMSKHGQGPRLLGRFPNGRVEEFIHARTLSAADLRNPEISALIATKLREFHGLEMPGPKKVVLWGRMRNWLKEARVQCAPKIEKEFQLDTLEKEISMLEKHVYREDQEIGFCHNDLQYGNIMIDEETNAITIIDYEYASYNPVAYDIANHFCEMAADYHSETPHILDYSKYPELEERKRFIKVYLNCAGKEEKEEEVEQLVNDVEKYTLANHLFWSLWGIISNYVNNIEFDYIEYARQRLNRYWFVKSQVLPYVNGTLLN
ncbi:hypothetical protein ACFE04_004325 [Oxalis oulophora]